MDPSTLRMQMSSVHPLSYKLYETNVIFLAQYNPLIARSRGGHWLKGSACSPKQIVTLKAKGASLKATEQPIDTSTAAGKAFLDMLGVFAEFETNLRTRAAA